MFLRILHRTSKQNNIMEKKTVVLEASVHPHELVADQIKVTLQTDEVMVMKITGEGLVMHGEHGTLTTESENVAKYVQQEKNPVTGLMQKAFD